MKLILEDVLSKILKSLERGYSSSTLEYNYVADDSCINDCVNSHNDFVMFFGKKALITNEKNFKKLLKEMLEGINFKLNYCDTCYDRCGNITNILLSVSLKEDDK